MDKNIFDIFSLIVKYDHDVLRIRRITKIITKFFGIDSTEQAKLAAVTSDILRIFYRNSESREIAFFFDKERNNLGLKIFTKNDSDHKLKNLFENTTSKNFLLINNSLRLLDYYEYIDEGPSFGIILFKKIDKIARDLDKKIKIIGVEISKMTSEDPLSELREQNEQLILTSDELKRRQKELEELNQELLETNKGVIALTSELEEQGESLKRANEFKRNIISHISHEFKAPISSIMYLSKFLSEETDGKLNEEQKKQVGYISESADNLQTLIDELLEFSKVEVGKIEVNPSSFKISESIGTLRGIFYPLIKNKDVDLVFDIPEDDINIYSDENKVFLILKNFISNALKFTKEGEVKVSLKEVSDDHIKISVKDSGIGIREEDREKLFNEFIKIKNPLQSRYKGTGLGLVISKRYADLLNGRIEVESEYGKGSTFSLILPVVYFSQNEDKREYLTRLFFEKNHSAIQELIKKDSSLNIHLPESMNEIKYLLNKENIENNYLILNYSNLDKSMWEYIYCFSNELKKKNFKIFLYGEKIIVPKSTILCADVYIEKSESKDKIVEVSKKLTKDKKNPKVLMVDDEKISRYNIKKALMNEEMDFYEASSVDEAFEKIKKIKPDLIFVDLLMPEKTGFDLIYQLKTNEDLSYIPIVIYSSLHFEKSLEYFFHSRNIFNMNINENNI